VIAFGPVPSRRLGRSLGINTIPPKHCPYSCIYCQVGRTSQLGLDRRVFYDPETILADVNRQLEKIDEPVDFLTIVPDGEPTLDLHLGLIIERLRTTHLPVAVISNASLIDQADVQHDLARADWVSLKVDAVNEEFWKKLNRPNRHLDLSRILKGIEEFAHSFKGTLVTESMLIEGVNDDPTQIRDLARYLAGLAPSKAYLSIPTRPPAEQGVKSPSEEVVNRAYQILAETVPWVEYLVGYEGNIFASTGNIREDLLRVSAVHPLREEAVRELLSRNKAEWESVEKLLQREELAEVEYSGHKYYTRRWRK